MFGKRICPPHFFPFRSIFGEYFSKKKSIEIDPSNKHFQTFSAPKQLFGANLEPGKKSEK